MTSCHRGAATRRAPSPSDSRDTGTRTVAEIAAPSVVWDKHAEPEVVRVQQRRRRRPALRLAGLRRSARQRLHTTARRLHVDVAAEQAERERVAGARGAGREVDVRLVIEIVRGAERRTMLQRHRHALAMQDRQQASRRVGGDTRGLETDRTRVQQRQHVGESALRRVGRVVERLVRLNGAAERATEAQRRRLLSRRIRARVGPLEIGAGPVSAQPAEREVRSGNRLNADLRAGESSARRIGRELAERDAHLRVGRKRADARAESVERRVVLVARQSERREHVGLAVHAGDALNPGRGRRRHRREVPRLVGGNLGRIGGERLVAPAHVIAGGVAVHERAVVGRDRDRVERHDGRGEPGVGEHHLLVAHLADLEPAAVEADLRDFDPVITLAVDEDDLEPAVLVGLSGLGDVALVGRRGDARAADGQRVGGGPVTRPRMMSVDCWEAAGVAAEAASRAPARPTRRARREGLTPQFTESAGEKLPSWRGFSFSDGFGER